MIIEKIVRAVHLLTAVILFFFSIIFIYYIYELGILPNKYYLILLGSIFLMSFVLSGVLLIKTKGIFIQILKLLAFVFCVLLFLVYGKMIKYIKRTNEVFSSFITKNEEVQSYFFISLGDKGYTEISDLDGKKVGYFLSIDDVIKDKVKLDINYIEYLDSNLMLEDLNNHEIDGILITDLLKDTIDNNNFMVLKQISITHKIEDITKRVSIKNKPFNILISGSDSRNMDINALGNNDVNIIVTINPNTNEVLLTAIPRDYYVQLHGTIGNKDKLTHAGYYGINTHVQTLEDLFDIEINYYVKVNFNTLIHLVDILDGIDIYSDMEFNINDCYYQKGMNHLNGKCALTFARERHVYKSGDRHRIKNQEDVLISMFNKIKKGGTLLFNYMDILDAIEGEFVTNLPLEELKSFIKYELNDLNKYEVYSNQVDGSDFMDYTYSYPNQLLYVMIPNEEDLNHAKDIIKMMINDKSIKNKMG